MSRPLLEARSARIDWGGATVLEELTFSTTTDAVLLVGAWQPLLSVLARDAVLKAGSLAVDGEVAAESTARGAVGLGLADAPLPPRWTLTEYLAARGRLRGLSARDATGSARHALDRAGLTALGDRRLEALSFAQRRVVALATAIVGEPRVVVLGDLVASLDDASVDFVVWALDRCLANRRWAIATSHVPLVGRARHFADRAAEALSLVDGRVLAQGPVDEIFTGASRYVLTVTRNAPALAAALGDRGVDVQVVTADPGLDGAARLVVRLPARRTTNDIVEAAVETAAPVIGLVPVSEEPVSPRARPLEPAD